MSTWKREYECCEVSGFTRYIYREEPSADEEYETICVVFTFENERYRCYIDAKNDYEALGVFFENHQNLTYRHIDGCFEC